ncbi:MAG: hypothetical protein R6T96_05170, partial [Longimicrobiales bacterium]
ARRVPGCEVTLVYRRTREEMPAYADEIQGALQEGITILGASPRMHRTRWDFPAPLSPERKTVLPRPLRAASRKAMSSSRTESLPTSGRLPRSMGLSIIVRVLLQVGRS